ncbi:uracil-DNA glycosylase [Maridesulfovibrio sp.]|uniref:uracil-DNA glycosylase n=1 Tax=Maridesulfovibrio sp. TaxID=2795000 RepID=UPI0029CA349A|nr:uracil-DNA glycosylase [Maridesulfovibrio sp.]
MRVNFCLSSYDVHESWRGFFTLPRMMELDRISSSIGRDFTPNADKVLRFCQTDLSGMKVVILGQDPYPQQGVATGRAFEVGDIKSWEDPVNNSLGNMIKLFHKNHTGIDEVLGIGAVRKDIVGGKFPLLPPKKLFSHLEEQGVLFLNTALTCKIGESNSHRDIWKSFSDGLLRFIHRENPQAKWLLWGGNACEMGDFVPAANKLQSHHPMLYSKKPGSFLGENHFARCPEINWVG